jgi:hypothetical protein
MSRMLGTPRRRFLVGGIVIVGLATCASLLLLLKGSGSNRPAASQGINTDEHLKKTGIAMVDPDSPPQSGSRTVSVLAGDVGYCVGEQRKPVGLGAEARERADTVGVGPATVHEFRFSAHICDGIGYAPPVAVRLSRPLGTRALITASKRSVFRTVWPSESQFQCMSRLASPREIKLYDGARTRDQVRTLRQVGALIGEMRRLGAKEVCGLNS